MCLQPKRNLSEHSAVFKPDTVSIGLHVIFFPASVHLKGKANVDALKTKVHLALCDKFKELCYDFISIRI